VPALSAPDGASACTEGVADAPLPAGPGGLTALAALMALFFALLRWRMNTPGEHLNFGATADNQPNEESTWVTLR